MTMRPELHAQEHLPFRPAKNGGPFLLAADIDGTMLGDDLGEAWLRALRREGARGTEDGRFLLAYVTGRGFDSVMEKVEEGRLPIPDFVCYDVGVEIRDLRGPRNDLGEKYAAQVGPDWNPEAVYALGEGDGVRRQAVGAEKSRFWAGFDWDGQPHTLEAFYRRVAGMDFCRFYPSYGAYIDALPNPLGKGRAVEFLQRELGLEPRRVVVAGDSGNDRQMFETRFQGILPANTRDELRAVADRPWHYHSPLPAGRGVMDGLLHFGFVEER